MEDILFILIVFGGGILVAISFSPVGKAIADWVRHGRLPLPPTEPEAGVWEELDRMRAEVSEMQERLEFSERLLSQKTSNPEEE